MRAPVSRHVAFLADSLVVGGAERVVEGLALGLPDHGFRVSIGCLRAAGPVGESLANQGVSVHSEVAPGVRDPRALFRVAGWMERERVDLLYVLDHSNALWHGRLAAALRRTPQLCAIHRTRRADGSPSLGWADRLWMGLSRAVIAVSEGHARYLHESAGIPQGRIEVVYNGVPPVPAGEAPDALRAELGLPPGVFLWAVVAALRPEKNHELALRALAELSDTQLVLIGSGEREPALRELADALGVQSRVHWLGLRGDVPRLLPAFDLVALSSHPAVETFPLSLLEAMAAGRPVLSTDVGSIREMVTAGETGYLVPAADLEAFVARLREFASDPQLCRRFGEAGRARQAERFSRETMVEQTARILSRVARET